MNLTKNILLVAVALLSSIAVNGAEGRKHSRSVTALADSILKAHVPDSMKILYYPLYDEAPEFPGGRKAMKQWVDEHMVYPPEAVKRNIEANVLVDFIVCADGTLKDICIKYPVRRDSVLNAEALRLFGMMPKWKPATYNGRKVNARYRRTIDFVLKEYSGGGVKNPVTDFHGRPFTMVSVSQIPVFPGGSDKMHAWIADNIIYPAEAAKEKIEGKVVVEFVISEHGKVESPRILRSVSPSLDREALRVIGSMPDWIPGRNFGYPVKTSFVTAVTFRLAKGR